MNYDYISIIGTKYPTIQVECQGDPTVYENLIWVAGPPLPSKEELDAAIMVYARAEFVTWVDEVADDVYLIAVSSPAKLLEYQESEKDALAFQADNTVVGPFVKVWADAKGWSNAQAADDILATALKFRNAMIYIRTQRLWAKEQIRNAAPEDFITIATTYNNRMEALKQQLLPQG